MPTEATQYAANIKHYNYVIYVDVLADDCRSVIEYVQREQLECSSRKISPTHSRVVFQPGTELDNVQAVVRRYDELHGPAATRPSGRS
jgi:hypothetical protein